MVMLAAMGLFLPCAPHALGFPHVPGSCFDMRVGQDECNATGLALTFVALAIRCATLDRHAPLRWRSVAWGVGIAAAWLLTPLIPWPRWTWG